MSEAPGRSERRRWRALVRFERWVEPAMVLLGFAWLALLVVDLGWGLARPLRVLGDAIWGVFIVDFLVRFTVAPRKGLFLARSWITLLALALPAFRVFRALRALRLFRATRGLRLVRLLTSTDRALKALGRTMRRRGAIYVGLLTVLVTLAGAAGMLAFEARAGAPFGGYGEAVWWTAMLVTTLGSDYWPQTLEGRILCLLLSVYAVGVFGYLAAALASYFVAQEPRAAEAGSAKDALQALTREVRELRAELRALSPRPSRENEAQTATSAPEAPPPG